MKHLFFTSLITVLLTYCSTPASHGPKHKGLSDIGRRMNLEKAATYSLISVEIGTPISQISALEDHLYGKFFNNRAEYYIVEQPQLYVAGTEVNRLTLYFIDGTLCKKKYELSEDIGPELMRSYGGFKFKALNTDSRLVSKTEKIIVKTDDGRIINEKLKRYQMKWKEDEDVMIKYQVFSDPQQPRLDLIEELTAYSYLLRLAEREI